MMPGRTGEQGGRDGGRGGFPLWQRRDRIISALGPRVTAQQTPCRKKSSLRYAMGHDSLDGIGRTGRIKAAIGPQDGRNEALIQADGKHIDTPCQKTAGVWVKKSAAGGTPEINSHGVSFPCPPAWILACGGRFPQATAKVLKRQRQDSCLTRQASVWGRPLCPSPLAYGADADEKIHAIHA